MADIKQGYPKQKGGGEDILSLLSDLRKKEDEIRQDIARKEAKIKETQSLDPNTLDDGDKKLLQDRLEGVVLLKERLSGVQSDIAALAEKAKLASVAKPSGQGRKDMDPDDHLEQRSQLRYGSVVNLDDLNIDEPAGGSADWLKIIQYILPFPLTMVLKALYMLTTRGRAFIKEHKGNRIRFQDTTSFSEDARGGRTPKHLFLSLATAQSSIRAEEITPGRFKTVVCGFYAAEVRARKLVSPVMGVVGFNHLADTWHDKIQEFESGDCPLIEIDDVSRQPCFADYFEARAQQLYQPRAEFIQQMEFAAEANGLHPVKWITEPTSIWVFACGPDRCPPSVLHVPGMPELGAFFALLQDIRNLIMASKLVGTSEEKLRKKSAFFQSYIRRTQSMGVQIDQRLVVSFLRYWGHEMVEHFHLGDDMDANLRKAAQNLIDFKVKEVSSQEPLKL
ncbi:NP [Lena virus]|uniref:Nucleoprotein n=2 Tax=Mammantavirinae TaxID=2560074 RepID=A0A5B7LJX1_9VIRU|nr:NP [Lena virus]QBH68029.1 NP [Lena virus]